MYEANSTTISTSSVGRVSNEISFGAYKATVAPPTNTNFWLSSFKTVATAFMR